MNVTKVRLSAVACIAATAVFPLSACGSSEQPSTSPSSDSVYSEMLAPAPQDKLVEYSSGVTLDPKHTFMDGLGVDPATMTYPTPFYMLVDGMQAVAPYGTKCVLVFTSKGVLTPGRVSGWVEDRFGGPHKSGFGNWGRSAIPDWLAEKEAPVCN